MLLCMKISGMGILMTVMNMKDCQDLLSSILKTAQMGQTGIQSILKSPLRANLRAALNSQLEEYAFIAREAQAIAASRGWTLEQLDPAAKSMARIMARSRLALGDINGKAAAMMIQGNTRGMIKGYKNLHQCKHSDERIITLGQRLLDCEHANIQQMQGFL